MKNVTMKYDYRNYKDYLSEEMQEVEEAYLKYKKDENNKDLYWNLKESIYNLFLAIKVARSCHYLTPNELDEMNKYYWELLI